MRASDINRIRALRFGQAVLLGVEFRYELRGKGEYSPKKWYYTMPPFHKEGYIAGAFLRRWEAVDAALNNLRVPPPKALPDAPNPDFPFRADPGFLFVRSTNDE